MAVDIYETEASRRAQERLAAAGLSVRQVWADLDLAWDKDDVERYLQGAPFWSELTERQQARVLGMVMAFAVVAVEQERVNVRFRLNLGRRR